MSKTEKKLDSWLWFILKIIPILAVLFYCISHSGTTELWSTVNFVSFLESVLQECSFPLVSQSIYQIFYMISPTILESSYILGAISLTSYFVTIELIRFLYIFFTFIFKLIRNWIEGWVL